MSYRFVFIVDTDKYAGNFERELCAYMTGRYDTSYGTDTHGYTESEIARAELPGETWTYFENHVIDCLEQPDDVPIHTPVVPWETSGWFNHGMGGCYRHGEEEKAFGDYKAEIEKYNKEHPTANLKGEKLNKWPAYLSIGIFFDERPSEEIVKILKERAEKFAGAYWPNAEPFGHALTISGYRIVKEALKVTASEEKV